MVFFKCNSIDGITVTVTENGISELSSYMVITNTLRKSTTPLLLLSLSYGVNNRIELAF